MHIKKTTTLLPLLLLSIFLLVSNSYCADTKQQKIVTVFVSILPEVDFVQRIGGNRIRVLPLVLPGQSPATYAPTPKQMATLARADLYFRIGVPFENALIPKLKHTRADLTIIDLRNGIELLGTQTGSLDPHIWLAPALVSKMAESIRDALIILDPTGADIYRDNCKQFQIELDQLDQQLRHILQPLSGHTIYVFHPAYAYFCRAYNLIQKPIAPGGKIPGARHLARLIEQAQKDQVQFIFIQPQFSQKTALALAKTIGATLIPLDPLAEDYMANMINMSQSIAASLDKKQL
jgi:zinc transport system substrate-binding protein